MRVGGLQVVEDVGRLQVVVVARLQVVVVACLLQAAVVADEQVGVYAGRLRVVGEQL